MFIFEIDVRHLGTIQEIIQCFPMDGSQNRFRVELGFSTLPIALSHHDCALEFHS